MKPYLFFILSACLLKAGAQNADFDRQFKELVEAEKKANASKIAPAPFTTICDYDVSYYRCEWQADPAVNFIKGEVTTYFKPLAPNFDSIQFNLSSSLTVDSIKYHGSSLSFNHVNDVITAVLLSTIPVAAMDSISVFYQGVPPYTGFGAFMQSTHSGAPIIWTLSEPYGSSDWWPCKNSLTDKADSIDVIVTAPIGNRVGSNGLLVSETTSGPNKIFHWKHRYPIATYLICFAVTNYAKYSNWVPYAGDTLEVLNYVYPEDSASAVAQTPDIVPSLQLYDTLFGVYPFQKEKYGHAEMGWGGAMEHQSMTFTTSFGHEILVHELGHQWFGDKVTCGRWEDIWLNEGFATYLSGLTYEHMFNGYWWMPFKSGRINDVTSQPGGSVWCNDTTDVNRIFDSRLSYNKGAMILHQLRWVIGDSAFFAALNNYLNDPNLAYKFAHTSDLKQHFETSSGQNLTWYFNDWYTGEGFPSYQITWGQTGSSVDLTVNQTQSIGTASFFKLPLPIKFKNQTQDTIIRFNNTFSGQTYTVTIPFTIDSVILDPDYWLITRNNTVTSSVNENELAGQISVFPNPVHDKLQIALSKPFADLSLNLMDVSGRTIKEVKANNLRHLMIDTGDISKGMYFIQFRSENTTATKKLIIQ